MATSWGAHQLEEWLGDKLEKESLRKLFLAFLIALALTLMVVSLAVMAQTSAIVASTWVLGSTLTSACLWLAVHLSMLTLGLPALIALAVIGGWLAAVFIVEMKYPGNIYTIFGLTKTGSTDTAFYKTGKKLEKNSSLSDIQIYIFYFGVLITFPISVPGVMLIEWLDKKATEEGKVENRPWYVVLPLVFLHVLTAIILTPFMALGILADAVCLGAKDGWNWIKSLKNSKKGGYKSLEDEESDFEVADRVKSVTLDVVVEGQIYEVQRQPAESVDEVVIPVVLL